jgi:hypothetical protein
LFVLAFALIRTFLNITPSAHSSLGTPHLKLFLLLELRLCLGSTDGTYWIPRLALFSNSDVSDGSGPSSERVVQGSLPVGLMRRQYKLRNHSKRYAFKKFHIHKHFHRIMAHDDTGL